jgi:uncharacterized protein
MTKSLCRWKPDHYYASIREVDFEMLRNIGIRVLLTDMDNTLTVHGAVAFDEYATEQVERMQRAGIECLLFSNAKTARLEQVSARTGLRFVPNPMKPSVKGIRRAFDMFPELEPIHFALVGDQIFTDIAAGKAGGIRSILIEPRMTHEPIYIRIKRFLEKPFKKKLSIDKIDVLS